ncbi:hypothetical protein Sinac_1083 [Singulisphaera acidiphila DSM 18658]|uniref:Ser-Thr-rich glycosyl-phosphatidyl-inositol-anchored membrane family protein n=1 Tax=Singulisphaera acidiphila (strain ATCC BAA-1392 / DSM 18658 / VKM B-2454 / MOB10) TaxID=886293 RepID=L0D8C4_SINAD|nr:hypothetical protein Sinac_1083 [Singulisphaera acidiphila DSM 18658]
MAPRGFRLRLVSIGLGLALVLGLSTPASIAAPPSTRASRVPTLYHKNRSFRIPFNVDPAERSRLKEVQLWVSNDDGFTWKPKASTTPDRPSFTFKATEDDEYWFAVRTLDTQDRLFPSDDEPVEPSMKVIVDTKPPSLVLEPDSRRGSGASVRWEVHDEHLALGSLVIEYQVDGADKWRKVTIGRMALIGSETWDAGTAEPITVRAQIEDRAGNIAEKTITLNEGTPSNPSLAASENAEFLAPPPLSSDSSFPPPASNSRSSESRDVFPPPTRVSKRNTPVPRNVPAPVANDPNPFPVSPDGAVESPQGSVSKGVAAGPSRSLLVKDRNFSLQYAVDDAGPNGPNTVELYVSEDGGRTWILGAEDQDKVSPIEVVLPGEGTFGLCLVARSAAGQGDRPPGPGESPQIWVEVDSTPPSVVMLRPPVVGTGQHIGKVAIDWRATDFHLGPRPITLSWRADHAGDNWQQIAPPMANTGRYIWNVPPNIPPRIQIRIEVADTLGNIGAVETTESGPVIVDRSSPKSRIIGLEPSAGAGNPSANAGNGSAPKAIIK